MEQRIVIPDRPYAGYSTTDLSAMLLDGAQTNALQDSACSAPHDSARLDTLIEIGRELLERRLLAACHDTPVLESPTVVRNFLKTRLAAREHEVFMVLFLNVQHRLIACEEMFSGTLSQTSVYPREVAKKALQFNSSAVILAHNHPSGTPEPSRADEALTRALANALALIDVRVLDHIVVGAASSVSFAERGLL
jgi:DNA repair protein RadC